MPIIANQSDMAGVTDARAGKYLTFQLDREEFGIGVLQVREIMGLQDITSVPHTPSHIRGVINLRGKVIPVLCLRSKFGLPSTEDTPRTCIIVVQVQGETGPIHIGVIVDCVSEVLNVNASELEDTPDFGSGTTTNYLLGMAKVKDTVKILLNIDEVIGTSGLGNFSLA
jgi:purine-binding chemotaxis protein CheW